MVVNSRSGEREVPRFVLKEIVAAGAAQAAFDASADGCISFERVKIAGNITGLLPGDFKVGHGGFRTQ